jgi:hypothetical protein
MQNIKFGGSFPGVFQLGYVVEDIHKSMKDLSESIGAGPWYYVDLLTLPNTFRGRSNTVKLKAAICNSGDMQLELIQQLSEGRSVFADISEHRQYGLHHQAIAVDNFDSVRQLYLDRGYEEVCFCDVGIYRIAFIDTKGALPFIVELVEATEPLERTCKFVRESARDWDGSEPIRKLPSTLSRRFDELNEMAACRVE